MIEFSYSEGDCGSNMEDGLRPERRSLQQPRQEKRGSLENTCLGCSRDLAAHICMPAGYVTLFVPCPESQKPCQLNGRGGENGSIPI